MKTTIELPDPLLREAKATAAARGESLKALVTKAVRNHLASGNRVEPGKEAWREVFGSVPRWATAEVDAAIEEAFEQIEQDEEL